MNISEDEVIISQFLTLTIKKIRVNNFWCLWDIALLSCDKTISRKPYYLIRQLAHTKWNEDHQNTLGSQTHRLRGLQTDDTVHRVREYFAESSFLNTSNERPLYSAWQTVTRKEKQSVQQCICENSLLMQRNRWKFANNFQI